MKKIHTILWLLSFACCANTYAQQMTAAEQQRLENAVAAGVDPYFKESTDTISTYGPDCITRDLLQDRKGNYWLATWKGIIKYDGKVFTNYTLKEGLIHFHVASCYEDKKGNIWFGTVRGGLYRYDPSASPSEGGNSFTLFTTKDGLVDNFITCFAEDKDGNMWLGSDNGVSRYNPSTALKGSSKAFTNFTVKDGLPSNRVSTIICDKTGKLWFGCMASKYLADDGGVVFYDPSKTGERPFTGFPYNGRTPFKTVTSLFEDKRGNMWIGGGDGLCRYNPSASLSAGEKSITDLDTRFSYYIIEDKAGNIWLTISDPPGDFHPETPNQILYRYDGKNFTKMLEKYAPGDCQIFGKIADKAGNIWIGTMRGLCKYDPSATPATGEAAFTYFTK